MKSVGYIVLLGIIYVLQFSERLGIVLISSSRKTIITIKHIAMVFYSSLRKVSIQWYKIGRKKFLKFKKKIRLLQASIQLNLEKKQLKLEKNYRKWKLYLKALKKKAKKRIRTFKFPVFPQFPKFQFNVKSKKKFQLKKIIVISTVVVVIVSAAGFSTVTFLRTLPDPHQLSDFKMPAATLIYDRNNTLLYSAYDNSYRIPVSLQSVPKTLIDATIATEDKRFYSHPGVDPIAIVRAIFQNSSREYTSGASTISQQLAKNIFLTNEKTITRKLKELVIALRVERRFTKDQILELYFNTVPYGGVANGVEAASQKYFGKHVSELTRKEAVFLASLPAAPSVFSQIDPKKQSETERMEYILNRMVEEGKITSIQKSEIKKEKLVFIPQITYKRAPHAVDFVLKTLEEKYGKDFVLHKGVVVKTTIDLPLQNYIQQVSLENISGSYDRNLTNAGIIVTDPKTGAILAMVGSVNYYDQNGGQYNVVTAKRQLGSTLKLLTYAQAFEKGYTPESTIKDEPTTFIGYPGYKPRNYDGKFHGTITLRSALANSFNIPALKLAYSLGIDNIARLGSKMGISEFDSLPADAIPLSLAIGGVEISLKNLNQAYSVVANGGKLVPLTAVSEIKDHSGNVLYKYEVPENPEQVISPRVAQNLTSVLSDSNARAPMFGRPQFFNFGNTPVAIKTGTSNDIKDNVAVAFSSDFVVSVWVGNNDGKSMVNILSGYSGASQIMHAAASKVLNDYVIDTSRISSVHSKN